MTSEDIREHLRKQPFEPFELVMVDGPRYPIRHPEMAIVTRTMVAIAIYKDSSKAIDDNNIADHTIFCSIQHIARLEPIGVRTA